MTTTAPTKPDFIRFFYKPFAVCGVIGLAAALIFGDGRDTLSFALGWFSIGLIVFLWDVMTLFMLKPRKTHWAWESLLALLRYVLLGGLFYAMISLFAVRWAWYIAGTAVFLPSLLIAAALFREES